MTKGRGLAAFGTSIILCVGIAACSGGPRANAAAASGAGQQGGGTSLGAGGQADDAQGGSASGPADMDQIGIEVVDALIPELAAVPVPDGAGFVRGTAFTADQDPRQTATQDVYTELSVADASAFYQDALAGAGFEITGVDQGTQVVISVVDPSGYEGDIIISPSSPGPPTQIHLQFYRAHPVAVSLPPVEMSTAPAAEASAQFEVDGNSYAMTHAKEGTCVVSPSEVNVSVSFAGGLVTAAGAPSGGWIQVSLPSGELWTGGLSADSPPARFELDGSSATWSGPMVETISGRTSDGSLTINC